MKTIYDPAGKKRRMNRDEEQRHDFSECLEQGNIGPLIGDNDDYSGELESMRKDISELTDFIGRLSALLVKKAVLDEDELFTVLRGY